MGDDDATRLSFSRNRRRFSFTLQQLFFLILIFHILCVGSADLDCVIRNLSAQQEDTSKDGTVTNMLVTWTATDCDRQAATAAFKVYATHKKYLACGSSSNGSNSSDLAKLHFEVGATNDSNYRLQRLKAFSEYNIEVVHLLGNESATVTVETRDGSPETTPVASDEPSTYKQAIKFYWKAPADCVRQNGLLDGYHVELFGVDSWVPANQSQQVINLPDTVNFVYMQNLQPYTRYKLQVFSRNKNGLWNSSLPLEMHARTQPDTPVRPEDIKLLPYETSVHMQWAPHFPPTGEVAKYVVRVGEPNILSGETIWKKRYDVPASATCVNELPNADDQSVCWVVDLLNPDTAYVFEIQTFNVGVDRSSEFSVPVPTRTKAGSAPTTTPSSLTPTLSSAEGREGGEAPAASGGDSTVIIVAVLVVAAVVLMIICFTLIYKIKMSKIKQRYEQNSSGSVIRSSLNSTYDPGTSTNDTTLSSRASSFFSHHRQRPPRRWSSQIEEIQSRRLPEPPPVGGGGGGDVGDSFRMRPASEMPVYSDAYSSDSGQYVDVSNVDVPKKHSPHPYTRTEDYTDVEGYLKPTFHQMQEDDGSSSASRPGENCPSDDDCSLRAVIPVESYETPRTLLRPAVEMPGGFAQAADPTSPATVTTATAATTVVLTESQPLILQKSVQV